MNERQYVTYASLFDFCWKDGGWKKYESKRSSTFVTTYLFPVAVDVFLICSRFFLFLDLFSWLIVRLQVRMSALLTASQRPNKWTRSKHDDAFVCFADWIPSQLTTRKFKSCKMNSFHTAFLKDNFDATSLLKIGWLFTLALIDSSQSMSWIFCEIFL